MGDINPGKELWSLSVRLDFWTMGLISKIFICLFFHPTYKILTPLSFRLVWFCGISSIVGYIMPNLFYTYVLNIWFLNTFCRKHFNEHELILVHSKMGYIYFYQIRIIHLLAKVSQVDRVFINIPGDLGSISVRVIRMSFKMVLDTSLLNTQQYKVRIKVKVEQSRERAYALLYTLV